MSKTDSNVTVAGGSDGAPPVKTVADLQTDLDAANAKIAELTQGNVKQSELEKRIVAKMGIGLTRAQAVAAIKRQDDFDASDYGKECADRHATRQRGEKWTPKVKPKTPPAPAAK